jgi:arylsulfatase A-like enzyme
MRYKLFIFVHLVFLLLALADAEEKPNIVFITLDTLRADHLGCYGYDKPTSTNIDALAKDSVLFSDAVTPAPLTTPSHASIFSGLYPRHHGVVLNNRKLEMKESTLAEILKREGYTTAGFVSIFLLDRETKMNRGFDLFSDRGSRGHRIMVSRRQKRAVVVINEVINWLEQEKKEPFFLWVHLYDPHWKYSPPEKYVPAKYRGTGKVRRVNMQAKRGQRQARRGLEGVTLEISAENKQLLIDLYDGEVTYMDDHLGRLFTYLKESGQYDDSVIICMADHAEIVGDRSNYFGHAGLAYDQVLRIPLMMKLPGIAPKKIDRFVRTIDVMPTLLAYLEIDDPAQRDGIDLLPLIKGEGTAGPEFSYIDGLHKVKGQGIKSGIMTARWKYWPDYDYECMFDRGNDPAETKNLATRMPNKVGELKALSERYEQDTPFKIKEAVGMDEEEKQELKSLGYL